MEILAKGLPTKIHPIFLFLLFAVRLSAGTILTLNAGNTIPGTEGASIGNTVLATFNDTAIPPTSSLSSTIDWGDGTMSAASISFVSGDMYDVSASHTFAEEGDYSYSIGVTDEANSVGAGSLGEAVIADAALIPGSPVNGSGMQSVPLNAIVGSFLDANPVGTVLDFNATIEWGDGSPTTAGTISQPGGVGTPFDVSGMHTYAADGLYGVTISIDDIGGSSTNDMATEQITPEPGTFAFCVIGFLFGYAALRLRRETTSRG